MNRREHAKIFMAVAIILCMSLSMTPAAMADTSGDGYLANMSNLKESEIISANRAMKNEEDAIIAYNEVISSFSLESKDGIYPAEYAGAYYEDGKLIICLTDLSSAKKNNVLNSTTLDSIVSFREMEYSLNELNSVIEVIVADLRMFPVTKWHVDQMNNKCVIGIAPDKYQDANNYFATLKQYEKYPVELIPADYEKPAANIIGGSSLGSTSVGFCGTYLGQSVILTCGHGHTVGQNLNYGTVQVVQLANNSIGDYAIVTISNAHTPTNRVYTSSGIGYIVDYYYSVLQNTTVYAYGKSNGAKIGTVSAVNQSVTYEAYGDIVIHGLTRCTSVSGSVVGGDSGGPVYRTHGTNYAACGIITSRAEDGSTWTFCPLVSCSPLFTVQTYTPN